MASQSFEEMEREYGYAFDDPLDDFGLGLSQHIDPYANHSNNSEGVYFDDIETSSPCPSGRNVANHVVYKQHDTSIESPYGDYIEEYDEEPPFAYSHNNTYAQRPRSAEPSHPTPFAPRIQSNSTFGHQIRRIQPVFSQTRPQPQSYNNTYNEVPNTGLSKKRLPIEEPGSGQNRIRLRPVSDLPDMYRALFKFGVFNAVQSECYDELMHGDDNMVISGMSIAIFSPSGNMHPDCFSAPTGSGKTILFELSIIRMLSGTWNANPKCIYVAPTKVPKSILHVVGKKAPT
ncbi:hypothetical protein QCA50_003626 [Cerrena zonata]|uniref:DEAD/DEAH-box helicase domain-containing protein n=1 Tax=Cerrena zonata TaxID=2478898 RepID=A0AAW0GLF0_9APHY